MGAGNACSSLYKCDANLKTGGGSKKQGVTSRVGLNQWSNREVQVQSNGAGRFKLFCTNQLGGVGVGHSMFGGAHNRADGVQCSGSSQEPNMITLTPLVQPVALFEQSNVEPGTGPIKIPVEPIPNEPIAPGVGLIAPFDVGSGSMAYALIVNPQFNTKNIKVITEFVTNGNETADIFLYPIQVNPQQFPENIPTNSLIFQADINITLGFYTIAVKYAPLTTCTATVNSVGLNIEGMNGKNILFSGEAKYPFNLIIKPNKNDNGTTVAKLQASGISQGMKVAVYLSEENFENYTESDKIVFSC